MRFIRNNPLLLLAIAALGFAVWVVSDLLSPPNTSPPPPPMASGAERVAALPMQDWPTGPSVVTPDLVPQLKPGMSRSEIEALIGPPPADMVSPVVEADGRFTYRVGYLANLDPHPVRSAPVVVGRRLLPAPPAAVPKSLLALEFDASKPGHPLVSIQYPDPLY